MSWKEQRVLEVKHFSVDQKERMNLDLRLIAQVAETVTSEFGGVALLDKGYAVDAHCGGKISRLHYDSDVMICLPPDIPFEIVISKLLDDLQTLAGFLWESVPQEQKSWQKFYQVNRRKWGETLDKGKDLAQQIDLHFVVQESALVELADQLIIRSSKGQTYPLKIQKVPLQDFFGQNRYYVVPTLEEILATKIRLLSVFREELSEELRQSDIYDFNRLLEHPTLDLKKVTQILSRFYKGKGIPEKTALLLTYQAINSLSSHHILSTAQESWLTQEILSLSNDIRFPTQSEE
jgi:hypothetical protein